MKEIYYDNGKVDSFPFCGYKIGVLVMKSWVPKPPGHISNASNYDFPIYYLPIENTNTTNIHGGSSEIIPEILNGVKTLEKMGCKAISTSCGYFGHFQKEIADKSEVPVYLSSICLAPFIISMMKEDQKLGIICYNKEKISNSMLESCGVTDKYKKRCVFADVINEKELGNIIKDQGFYNIDVAKEEVVKVAIELFENNSDIGAILLECTDLPPHAHAIQEKLKIPVFTSTDLLKFIYSLY
ncbi:aspartate/glutamate racemase family protein [Methanobrevibacter sp.]